MKRAIILQRLLVKALSSPPPDNLAACMQHWSKDERLGFDKETQQLFAIEVRRLRHDGLWNEMEKSEQRFIEAATSSLSHQQLVDASWLAEPAACLLWALQHIEDLPSYDEEASQGLLKVLSETSVRTLVTSATLRSRELIEAQRDAAELWNWRARTRRLIESGEMRSLPRGITISQIIEIAALRGAEDGLLPQPIAGDFPAFGKPYRAIGAEEFAIMSSIAQERHRAFNWLCGYSAGNRWADTPTDT